MDAQHLDEPAYYAARPVIAPDHAAYHRDPEERRAMKWLIPMAAITGLLVLLMIGYFAARQY